MDKKREKEENKRKEEEKIEKAKKLEEYLKNKKSPAEYLSLLEKEKIYFVSHIDYIKRDYGNTLIEAEVINNVPVLRQLEYIHGKKIKFTDSILDEQFDNPYLPEKWREMHDLSDCDFAFFDRYSDSKDNLNNISSYLKFLEKDGEMKIWACYNSNVYGAYGPQSIENILSYFKFPQKRIRYTGKYVYEKIEIIKNFDRDDPNYTPAAGTKEIYITYSDLNNLIMYEDDDSKWRYIEINDRDINNPGIGLFAADGGGGSASTYIYFKNDDLIYHRDFHRYDMETEELLYDVEYNIYYKKTASGNMAETDY